MTILKDGQIIHDTYEVERLLGEGAFAWVYRVKHKFLGRLAMKVFKTVGATKEDLVLSLGEAGILSGMGHPNIIRVFEANTIETAKGIYGFFTMEYVAGGSLEQFWKSHGAEFVPVPTTVEIMKQTCRGVSVAHCATPPIVHRDIKLDNILVGYEGDGIRVRVSDFGLAKHVNPLTFMATTLGALAFKAPEALQDLKGDSRASDVWALGTTTYLLLTDRMPYADPSHPKDPDRRLLHKPLVPPSAINIQVDSALDRIVTKSLSVQPRNRYPTARELCDELSSWRGHDTKPLKFDIPHTSKVALGAGPGSDTLSAERMAQKAVEMSRQAGRLSEAADLLEEAMTKSQGLRGRYEYQLRLWRKGMVH